MKNNFLSVCQKSCYICDQSQYEEAGFIDKLKLKMHLALCKSCREYNQKNSKLSALIQKSDVKCMCSKKKKELQKIIESEMKKSS